MSPFCKNSKLASIWKDVKHCTEVSSYPICCQLLKWLMLWEEEVAKKREETEDLQKKLQEASAMQAGLLPFFCVLLSVVSADSKVGLISATSIKKQMGLIRGTFLQMDG